MRYAAAVTIGWTGMPVSMVRIDAAWGDKRARLGASVRARPVVIFDVADDRWRDGSVRRRDIDQAQAIIAMDDRVDTLEAAMLHDLAKRPPLPPDVAPSVGLILVARALERMADHATNIREEIYYWLEGEDIRHR